MTPRRTALVALVAGALIAAANVMPAQAATDVTLCIKDGLIVRAVERVAACPARARRIVLTAPVGPMGPQGPAGPAGADGAKGETGPQGPMGPQGSSGGSGATGRPGAQGEQGEQGIQGEQGLQGERGIQGERGATGAAGTNGTNGTNGAAAGYAFSNYVEVAIPSTSPITTATVVQSTSDVPAGKYIATLSINLRATAVNEVPPKETPPTYYRLACQLTYPGGPGVYSADTTIEVSPPETAVTTGFSFTTYSSGPVGAQCRAYYGGIPVSGVAVTQARLTLVQVNTLTTS